MTESYEYKERQVELDQSREMRFGEGRISANAGLFLSVLCLLAVCAYLFPAYLTTEELRQAYDPVFLQGLLKYSMYFSLFLSTLALILNKGAYKWRGLTGIAVIAVCFLLGGYSIPIGNVERVPLSLGVDWLILAFLGSVVVFMTLEKVLPKYKNQVIFRPEWGLDLWYFSFNHLAITAIILFANYHASHFDWAVSADFQETIQSIPVFLQVIIIILAADFVLYWEHRLYHENKKLWPVHAVHHSVESMDWLAGSRGHFFQVFSERALVMIPLYLLGPSEAALNAYVTFAALQAIIIHCNTSLPFGPLKYIFVTPQFHHWHHGSDKPAIDTNYGAHTIIYDFIFRTYHMPEQHWPIDYGTTKRLPRTFIGQLMHPIKELFAKEETAEEVNK